MRLGADALSRRQANAQALADGGADEIVVHARTQQQGYRLAAYWEPVAAVRQAVAVPVVANGEVWNVDDARRCLAISGFDSPMLGRGIVSDSGLAWVVRGQLAPEWPTLQPLLRVCWDRVALHGEPRHVEAWLGSAA